MNELFTPCVCLALYACMCVNIALCFILSFVSVYTIVCVFIVCVSIFSICIEIYPTYFISAYVNNTRPCPILYLTTLLSFNNP